MIVYCEMHHWHHGDHYYGFLTCGDKRVELEGEISQSEADRLSRRENLPADAQYKAGEMCGKFFAEDRLKTAAIAQYKTLFPGATALILGDDVDPDPQPIWDGPFQHDAAELVADAIQYCGDEHAMNEIREDWEEILAQLGG